MQNIVFFCVRPTIEEVRTTFVRKLPSENNNWKYFFLIWQLKTNSLMKMRDSFSICDVRDKAWKCCAVVTLVSLGTLHDTRLLNKML